MLSLKTNFVLIILCLTSSACSVDSAHFKGAATKECPVCRYNADLACVDVGVTESTPRADYAGKTEYFCTVECKETFLKEPGKYVVR